MKIQQWIFISLMLLFFMSCSSGSDSSEDNSGEESSENISETEESEGEESSDEQAKPKADEANLYLEVSISGGILDGQTFMCKPRYSANDQSTIEEGDELQLEFTRAVPEDSGLQFSFELYWKGGFSTGEKELGTYNGKSSLDVYSTEKEGDYDFERLVYNFDKANINFSKVEDWGAGGNTSKAFFEGELEAAQATQTRFTSQFDKDDPEPVSLKFKFRARAIKY